MFSLDYKSRLPIYEQLCQSITKMAALGALAPGEQLPSVRSLAQKLGVNPNTVQKAYQILERDGLLFSVPGKGSFLSKDVSAVQQQRREAVERLREAAANARKCGVPEEEALGCVSEVFRGGVAND